MATRNGYNYNFDANYVNEVDADENESDRGPNYKELSNYYSVSPKTAAKSKTRVKLTSSKYCDEDVSSSTTSPYFDEFSTDWNDEFQKLLDQFAGTQNLTLNEYNQYHHELYKQKLEEKFEISSKLRYFCARFGAEATEAAKLIIAENDYPLEEKTVRPTDLGGFAGGSKFVWKNMVLKFAIESEDNLYGGNNELIMKVANQELKGLESLIECKIQGLHFPLVALVDYHGYRVIVSSLLPIDKSTIVYGSPDGGLTVHDKNKDAKEKIAQAASLLNLKKHFFETVEFYGPVDMEVHKGKDGRLYVVDTSRLFPPTLPIANNLMKKSGQLLAYHLRPMIVRKFSVPLSSDGLSSFGRQGKEEHDPEIIEATKFLINEVIPKFAKDICQNSSLRNYNEQSILAICRKFHVNGINLRYLGVVRRFCTTRIMKDILLIMAIARAAKSILQTQWRNTGLQDIILSSERKGSLRIEKPNPERKFKRAVAGMLSNLIAKTDLELSTLKSSSGGRFVSLSSSMDDYTQRGNVFWTQIIQETISQKYVDTLTKEEEEMDLRKLFVQLTTWRNALVSYFNTLIGLPEQDWTNQFFVKEDSIKTIAPRTKLVNIAYKDLGISQVALANMQMGSGKSLELVLQAEQILNAAYKVKSDDTRINKSIAANIVLLGKLGLVDQDKMLHAETLCDDCLYDPEARMLKAKLIYQRSFVRVNARTRPKREEAANLLETAFNMFQQEYAKQLDKKGTADILLLVMENDARVNFATIGLEVSTSEKVFEVLSGVKRLYLPLPLLNEYIRCTVQALLNLRNNFEQNYQKAVQMIRGHCTQNPEQYAMIELWNSIVVQNPKANSNTNLADFMKEEQTLFEEFIQNQRKLMWPENNMFTIQITTTASGSDIKQKKVDLEMKSLQTETIPFLKEATFRFHSTFYPNLICLNQAPFAVPLTASYGVATARIEIEFCSCFVAGKESKGWIATLEWPITPEKDGTFSHSFEINLATRTVIDMRSLKKSI